MPEKSVDAGAKKEKHFSSTLKSIAEKEGLLQLSEMSLLLDTYDDIFSDFDPRPYSQRKLSDDFLNESKKIAFEKNSGQIELKFLAPKDKRNSADEATITKRLREHFKKHKNLLEKEIKGIRMRSAGFLAIGLSSMLLATSISAFLEHSFLSSLLFVLLEPAGWFITWFSLDQIFYTAAQKKPDLDFYRKMANAQITFETY
ncbi:MAG TPA: hypothetical protein VJK05_05895 [archaeon]|nr:hypothetical protein [archaeon]